MPTMSDFATALRPPVEVPPRLSGAATWAKAPLSAEVEPATEFELRRRLCSRLANRKPLERVAALLMAISRNNGCEGRDPSVIPDSLTSGFVADLLGMSVSMLADLLLELASEGLVQPSAASGLRINDLAALERLADAH